ncbi:MAG: glycosyltransferase, partial [Devosia sp.]|uniref:tetratricopeptide repeat protein n=1 Tax=Devosia sp. TaxID=1871048 RepID=UPI00263271A1
RNGLEPPDVFAARVRFRATLTSTLYREYRLFRNDPRLRFKGAMHESIRPDLDHLQQAIGARVVDNAAMLTHLGYEGDMTAKYRRNLPLLREAVRINPDRLYYWNDLAQTLGGLGEIAEAVAVAREGLGRGQHRSDHGSRVMRGMLAQTLAGLLLQRGDDARALIDEGLAVHPVNWSLLFLKARALVNSGDYREALQVLAQLTAQDAEAICDDDLSHDIRIFGCYAHDLAGVAHLRMENRQQAADAFARAFAAAPDELAYRVKALALGAAAA